MPYRLSAFAERDLDKIWSYLVEDASPTIADRLIDAIIERFEFAIPPLSVDEATVVAPQG